MNESYTYNVEFKEARYRRMLYHPIQTEFSKTGKNNL